MWVGLKVAFSLHDFMKDVLLGSNEMPSVLYQA